MTSTSKMDASMGGWGGYYKSTPGMHDLKKIWIVGVDSQRDHSC